MPIVSLVTIQLLCFSVPTCDPLVPLLRPGGDPSGDRLVTPWRLPGDPLVTPSSGPPLG